LGGDERSQSIDDNDGLQQNGKFIYISLKKLQMMLGVLPRKTD